MKLQTVLAPFGPVAIVASCLITITGTPALAQSEEPASACTAPASFDDSSTAVEYSWEWTHATRLPVAACETISRANAPGATATFRFSGASVSYVFRTGPNMGIAAVTIDGTDAGAVDLYSPHIKWQVSKWYGLTAGDHTLEVRVTGYKHRAAADTYVNIDRFIVDAASVGRGLYDDAAADIRYGGAWSSDIKPQAYNRTITLAKSTRRSRPTGAFFSLSFVGDQITLYSQMGRNRGRAAISIDGVDRGWLDLYAPTNRWQVASTIGGLGPGVHELHVAAIPEKNIAATDDVVTIDLLRVGRETRCAPGGPSVIVTYLPPLQSTDNLEGRACNVDPALHVAVTYIKVGTQWWIKPYANNPLTTLQPTGLFVTDITTGGFDTSAVELAVYIIPYGYAPPILLGSPEIPSTLDAAAVAKTVVMRQPPPPPFRGPVLAPVSSSFSTSLEGWTNPSIRFVAALGNPAGAMEFQEYYRAGDGFAFAPTKYLGSLAHFDETATLTFQQRVPLTFGAGYWGAAVPREVRLSGPGGSATWTGSVPTFSTNWVTVTVPLDPAYWTQTSGTWVGLLEQVTAMEIRVDHFNDLFGVEQTQFDNVVLSPGVSP